MPACVLEVVVGFDDRSGELSLLADQDQAPVKVTGDRGGKDKAPRLGTAKDIIGHIFSLVLQGVHRKAKPVRVCKERGDIPKLHAGARKIGNGFQIGIQSLHHLSWHCA